MDTMNLRIKYAREALGKTQTELGAAVGVTPQAVQQWESGETAPRGKRIEAIAKALKVSLEWLQLGGNVGTKPRPIDVFEDDFDLPDEEVEVPSYNIKFSAGSGRIQWEIDDVGKANRFRKDWCKKKGVNPSDLVTLLVDGDSMLPTFPDGTSATVDRSVSIPKNGRVHAIDYMGEFFIKRLFKQPNGSILIQSDNPDKSRYPDWIVTEETPDALKILGLVISVQHDI